MGRYNFETVREWRLKAWGLGNNQSRSKRKISHLIAEEFGVPWRTVANYVFYGGRNLWRPPRQSGPKDKVAYRQYDLRYKHLIRRLDTVLPQLYNGNAELSLEEMSVRIETHAGIRMQAGTLEKLLGKYNGERGPPVLRTGSGRYQLNPSYYSSRSAPAYQETGV